MFRFLDGYDSLMQALWAEAESYGATINLKTIVKEIHWSGDRVEAVCEDDDGEKSFAASRAIVTLPLGVLQTNRDEPPAVRFVPELPPEKRAAINHLAMGNVLRIVLRFRERFWESLKLWDKDANQLKFADAAFIHYPDASIPTWWTQLPIRAPVLIGWAGGPRADSLIGTEPLAVASGSSSSVERTIESSPALQRWDREPSSASEPARATDAARNELLDQAIASLAVIFNISTETVRDQLDASYFHDWRHDPFSRGAYSYVPVNGLDAQKILSQPIDNRLFFAGEATAVGHIGTVHGAIQSGQRAAREVPLHDLSKILVEVI
ncbi:MAG: hypothetical protein DMF76_09250 [Acidobacteria bacterium]|nr:MAG: hypothetical protein DMF76_09250 [Acidobacteriota bacterium]